MSRIKRPGPTVKREAMQLFRQATEVVELFVAKAGHERHSSGVSAVELAECGLDPGVDLIAVRVNVLTHGSIDDVLLRTGHEVSRMRHKFNSGGVDLDRRTSVSDSAILLLFRYQNAIVYRFSKPRATMIRPHMLTASLTTDSREPVNAEHG